VFDSEELRQRAEASKTENGYGKVELSGYELLDVLDHLEMMRDAASRPALRIVRGGDSPEARAQAAAEARAQAAEARVNELEARLRGMRELADERVAEAARHQHRVLELEKRIEELERSVQESATGGMAPDKI
jgi:chromosome segregation ATPase